MPRKKAAKDQLLKYINALMNATPVLTLKWLMQHIKVMGEGCISLWYENVFREAL